MSSRVRGDTKPHKTTSSLCLIKWLFVSLFKFVSPLNLTTYSELYITAVVVHLERNLRRTSIHTRVFGYFMTMRLSNVHDDDTNDRQTTHADAFSEVPSIGPLSCVSFSLSISLPLISDG